MTTFREYRERVAVGDAADHGLPDLPSDALAVQGDRAGFVSRAVAAGIDVILVFVVVLLGVAGYWMLTFFADPVSDRPLMDRLPPFLVVIGFGYALNVTYWTVGWATGGRTIGNLVMGLRVVNFRGAHLHWFGALLRALFCTLFVPGLLWAIVSSRNRSVQDVVLRTSVIHDWIIGVIRLPGGAPTVPGAQPVVEPPTQREGDQK